MRVVFRKRAAIVATLSIVAGVALSGCGQRGSLYLPTVPPLPAKPTDQTQAPSSSKPDVDEGSIPDTSGTPLSLSPDAELRNAPGDAPNATPAEPASGASDAQ
jgi:predicted small lipoprotein YifL